MVREEFVTLTEYAKRIGVTRRRVEQLRIEGLPMQNGKVPWPAGRIWRDRKLVEQGRREVAPTEGDEVKNRKTAAEAALAELELERQRGTLIPLVEMEREVGRMLDGLRARVLAMPSKYAPRLGLPIGPAQLRLEEIGRELMAELADTADDFPDDDEHGTDPA